MDWDRIRMVELVVFESDGGRELYHDDGMDWLGLFWALYVFISLQGVVAF